MSEQMTIAANCERVKGYCDAETVGEYVAHFRTDLPRFVQAVEYMMDEGLDEIDTCRPYCDSYGQCDCVDKNRREARARVSRILNGE